MAIVLVNTATHGNSVAGSTCAATLSSTTTGNLLVVFSAASDSSGGTAETVSSISCNGATFATTGINQLDSGATSSRLEIWYAKNIDAATTPTLTVTYSASSTRAVIIVREYSGINWTRALDITKSGSSSANPGTSGASSVTTYSNSLVVGGMSSHINDTYSAGSGYGNYATDVYTGSGTGLTVSAEDKIISTAGSQTATFGNASLDSLGIGLVVLNAYTIAQFSHALRPHPFSPGIAR